MSDTLPDLDCWFTVSEDGDGMTDAERDGEEPRPELCSWCDDLIEECECATYCPDCKHRWEVCICPKRTFDNADDAIAWLESDDDDDGAA